MYKEISLLLSALSFVFVMSVNTLHAAPVKDVDIGALISKAKNPPGAKAGKGSTGGQAEHSMGVGSDGNLPQTGKNAPQALVDQLAAQGCYDMWWVSGNHTWSSKSYYFYATTDLSARTWTRYGTATAPCDIPLTVDKIEVIGSTLSNNIVTPKARVNAVLYNTSSVSASGNDKVYGINVKYACGATVLHRATKYGVTWHTVSHSGCYGAY